MSREFSENDDYEYEDDEEMYDNDGDCDPYDPYWMEEAMEQEEQKRMERDTFNALTDGQYGDYDEWRERGGDIDSLMDSLGY